MPKGKKSNKNKHNNSESKAVASEVRKIKNMLESGSKGVGYLLGGTPGGAAGAFAGRALGALAGKKLTKYAKWVGHGDYMAMTEVAKNSLIQGNADTSLSFGAPNSHSYHFTKREYIGSIRRKYSAASGIRFEVQTFPLQPGLSKVFPVSSILAPAFTKYKCHGMVFEMVSAVSGYSSVSTTGTVAVTCDYNPSNPPFSSKVQMENTSGCVTFAPYKNCCYAIECDPNRLPYKEYFIRTGNSDAVPNINEDMGTFQVALCDLPSVYNVGDIICELWVTAEWTFFEDRLPVSYGGYLTYNARSLFTGSLTGNLERTRATYGALSSVSVGSNIDATGGIDLNSIYPDANNIYFDGVPMGTVIIVTIQLQNDQDLAAMSVLLTAPTTAVNGCKPALVLPDNGVLVSSRTTNDPYTTNTEKYTFEFAVEMTQESGTGFALCPYVVLTGTITGTATNSWGDGSSVMPNIAGRAIARFYKTSTGAYRCRYRTANVVKWWTPDGGDNTVRHLSDAHYTLVLSLGADGPQGRLVTATASTRLNSDVSYAVVSFYARPCDSIIYVGGVAMGYSTTVFRQSRGGPPLDMGGTITSVEEPTSDYIEILWEWDASLAIIDEPIVASGYSAISEVDDWEVVELLPVSGYPRGLRGRSSGLIY